MVHIFACIYVRLHGSSMVMIQLDSGSYGVGIFSSVLAFLPLLPDSLGLLCFVLALWRTSV